MKLRISSRASSVMRWASRMAASSSASFTWRSWVSSSEAGTNSASTALVHSVWLATDIYRSSKPSLTMPCSFTSPAMSLRKPPPRAQSATSAPVMSCWADSMYRESV